MELPSIAPYPMPDGTDLPANRVNWQIAPQRAALLIHDMQRHFVDAFDTESAPIPDLIAHIIQLRARCRALGIPVIYSAQPTGQTRGDRGLLQDFWGDGIGTNLERGRIIDPLTPGPQDTILTKWRYSAFVRTDLHGELRSRGRDQLMICGIYAHIGCLMTAAQAFMEEVQPFLVADAVADFSRVDHHMALDYAARRCAVTLTTKTALDQLGPGRGGLSGEQLLLLSGPMREHVRSQLAALADGSLDGFADDDDLSDAGIDSIRLMALITEWQNEGFAVSFEELIEEPTIARWAGLLAQRSTHPAS